MKKFMIILLALLMSSALFAEFDLGVKLSANYAYLGSEDIDPYLDAVQDLDNINGYMAGVFLGLSSNNLGISLEASAPLEGFSISSILEDDPIEEIISDTELNYELLSAVLMLRYELDLLLLKPYVGAGVSVGIPVMDFQEGVVDSPIEEFDISRLGYALSVGVVVLNLLDVDVRYISGTTNILTNEYIVDDPIFGEQVRLSLGLHIF